MKKFALVSIFCADQEGLVAAIAGRLFDLGINLGATSFAVLGQGAEFTSVVELPGGINLDALNAELSSLAVLGDAEIKVSDFKLAPLQGPTGQITHQITLTGGDQPGLIARLCEVFIEFKANIVRLVTGPTADGLYIMRLSVFIPKNAADACLATVKNTAENLQMSFTSEGL